MWEIIKSNQRKSWFIFLAMGFCLISLGWVIGETLLPPEGGAFGILAAGVIWTILSLISYFSGDSIVLSSSHAKEVTREMHPMLFNIVEEMKIAASLPALPKIYIIDDPAPNAFATGRSPEKSAVAVTAGLLQMCTRDELQGVIAHEMSHILNRDVLYVTFAGILLGSIALLSEVFLRSLSASSSSRRYRSDNNGGQAQAVMIVIALLFAVLAPILARLLYFSLSRKREYLADACAVRLTRYPEGLASALEKISGSFNKLASANSITAPMYISTPYPKKGMSLFNFSTHPPIQERIKILRAINQGANFKQYMEAYSTIKGKSSLIPDSAMKDNVVIPLIDKETQKVSLSKNSQNELFDLMRAVNNFTFITCLCGLKIKVPPNYNNSLLTCPKCGKKHPVSDKSTEQKKNRKIEKDRTTKEQMHIRKQNGWETVPCKACGKNIQLSPGFTNSKIFCQSCGQTIIVQSE